MPPSLIDGIKQGILLHVGLCIPQSSLPWGIPRVGTVDHMSRPYQSPPPLYFKMHRLRFLRLLGVRLHWCVLLSVGSGVGCSPVSVLQMQWSVRAVRRCSVPARRGLCIGFASRSNCGSVSVSVSVGLAISNTRPKSFVRCGSHGLPPPTANE